MIKQRRKTRGIKRAASGISALSLAVLLGAGILGGNRTDPAGSVIKVTPVGLPSNPDIKEGGPSAGAPGNSLPDPDTSGSGAGIQDTGSTPGTPESEAPCSSPGQNAPGQESLPETGNNNSQDLQALHAERQPDSPEKENALNPSVGSEDVPVSEQSPGSIQAPALSKKTPEFFGGSYTDAQGRFVVLLTEDTPANRSAICRDFGLNESSTVFASADYSLAYLTELQSKVSAAMVNKELPFVTVSSLREDTNRLHLTVTTENEEDLAKVKALDTLGGALVMEYSGGNCIELHHLVLPKTE